MVTQYRGYHAGKDVYKLLLARINLFNGAISVRLLAPSKTGQSKTDNGLVASRDGNGLFEVETVTLSTPLRYIFLEFQSLTVNYHDKSRSKN